MLELKRMWHPVSIGEAILNIYQNRITSTLTGFKNCPSFGQAWVHYKDLPDTKQTSQPMIYILQNKTIVIFYTTTQTHTKGGKDITLDLSPSNTGP